MDNSKRTLSEVFEVAIDVRHSDVFNMKIWVFWSCGLLLLQVCGLIKCNTIGDNFSKLTLLRS